MGYNEADTRAKLINPKLHEAGWSEDLIRREITAGTEFQKEKKRQVLRFILSTDIINMPNVSLVARQGNE